MSKSKKQFKKSIEAAMMNFACGMDACIEQGKTAALFDVKMVMDAAADLAAAGLTRYAEALMSELQADLTEITEPAPNSCDGCAGCNQDGGAA